MTDKIPGNSFWDKPEGVTGTVVGIGALALLGYGAYKIMPYVVDLLQNTLYALGLGAILLALVYMILDPKFRNRLWLIYQVLMEEMTYAIIKKDPFRILRITQEVAKKRTEEVDEARTQVKAKAVVIQKAIEKFKNDAGDYAKQIAFMREHQRAQDEIDNVAMRLGRVTDAQTRLGKSYTQTTMLYEQLSRAYKSFAMVNSNIDFEIDLQQNESEAAQAGFSAVRIMRAALHGTDENSKLQKQAFQIAAQQYGEQIGQIESFMDDAKSFLDNMDMQNAMYTDDGMKALENLNSRQIIDIGPQLQTPVPGQMTQTPGRSIDYTRK